MTDEHSQQDHLPSSDDAADFEGDVNRRLARVWRDSRLGPTVENLRRRILHEGDSRIELAQYRLLHALNEQGPMSMRTLAETVGATASSISRTVQRLETAGLVTREQSDRDHRSFTVSSTMYGTEVHAQLIDRAFDLYKDIFAVFTLEEREDLADLLERLLKSADSTLATRTQPAPDRKSTK